MSCTTCQDHPHNYANQPKDADCHTCRNIEVKDVRELPIDRTGQVPDYFFTVRVVENPTDGTMKYQPTLVGGQQILPNGNLANTFMLYANNPDFKIPEGQVVPAYISTQQGQNIVMLADQNHPAQFLVVGAYADQVICQNVGAVNILVGHKYLIGVPYYRSNTAGQVTTDKTQTGQYLFTPVSPTQLVANITVG